MSVLSHFSIDINERFPHLPKAPIVEAVIDIRAHPTVSWDEASIRAAVEAKLSDYKFVNSQREFQWQTKIVAGKPPSQECRDLGWKGLRYDSPDKKHVVQFSREGFAFSRLQPYHEWAQLRDEALRLWRVYVDTAAPAEIGRIGTRYINRIDLPIGESDPGAYVVPAPQPPPGVDMRLRHFMHSDILEVPDRPYAVRVAKTLQDQEQKGCRLILDIDVFTLDGQSILEANIGTHLQEMRWLKNRVFFSSITTRALQEFGGGPK
jgi:uncharacterized protein (TIGR04255 family)